MNGVLAAATAATVVGFVVAASLRRGVAGDRRGGLYPAVRRWVAAAGAMRHAAARSGDTAAAAAKCA